MTEQEFQQRFSIALNPQQQAAVRQTEGPVLLLAVPGSGKTTVLVSRLGYMIYCKGIPPEQILTVTYTVAATRDMRERFINRFGEEHAKRLTFRTINGICAVVVQYYAAYKGTQPFALVSDEKKLNGVVRELLSKGQRDLCEECLIFGPDYPNRKKHTQFLDSFAAVWYYEENVRVALLRFKFYRRRDLAPAFGRILAMKLLREYPEGFDVLTWIPVSRLRKFRRGYDQCQLLAKTVGAELGMEPVPVLKKIRNNRRQSGIVGDAQRSDAVHLHQYTAGNDGDQVQHAHQNFRDGLFPLCLGHHRDGDHHRQTDNGKDDVRDKAGQPQRKQQHGDSGHADQKNTVFVHDAKLLLY